MLCHGKAWVLGPLALHEARPDPASQPVSQSKCCPLGVSERMMQVTSAAALLPR